MRCDDLVHAAIEEQKYLREKEKVEELYHHGIIGMKWGVRRYQNEDGSLTSAGRTHKQQVAGKLKEAINNRIPDKKEFGIETARKLNKAAMDYSQKKRDEQERARLENESPKNKLRKALTSDVKDLFKGEDANKASKKTMSDRFTDAITSKNAERAMTKIDKTLNNPKTKDYITKAQNTAKAIKDSPDPKKSLMTAFQDKAIDKTEKMATKMLSNPKTQEKILKVQERAMKFTENPEFQKRRADLEKKGKALYEIQEVKSYMDSHAANYSGYYRQLDELNRRSAALGLSGGSNPYMFG